ncbi:hypothetical protein [Sporolactobacillus pectinivorans]|uniref:hypothetical protein n=1 Tax=Sporolactobacillus pectinivorans TaxID=1591408 RepID=UPI0012FE1404|nr:hypothetical protein [Sporolactobacillus pectinivorans]
MSKELFIDIDIFNNSKNAVCYLKHMKKKYGKINNNGDYIEFSRYLSQNLSDEMFTYLKRAIEDEMEQIKDIMGPFITVMFGVVGAMISIGLKIPDVGSAIFFYCAALVILMMLYIGHRIRFITSRHLYRFLLQEVEQIRTSNKK